MPYSEPHGRKTGIEGLTFHDTRHEAITRLAGKLNVLDLARMVGHRDIKQLQAYYNATAEDIAMKTHQQPQRLPRARP